MSGSATLSDLPLSDAEKVDVRRFCGYPAIGSDASGQNSWRFFQSFGQFEWKIANLAGVELSQVRLYLSQMYPLEAAIVATSANLDTAKAASWTHNAREVEDRCGLYDLWRRRLCGFLGVLPGPDLGASASVII